MDIAIDSGPPPALTTSCLNNSLTAPTWTIDAFSYNQAAGVSAVNFILTANMFDVGLDCFGQTEGSERYVEGDCMSEDEDHQYSAKFVFESSARRLSIEQAWACDGNADEEPCKSSVCTSTNPVRIPAKLLEPVQLSPYIPPAPPGHDSPRCASRSESPSWTISGLEWRTGGRNYTWQGWVDAGWGIVGVGMVKLNITNRANNQAFSCVWRASGKETSNVTNIDPPSGLAPFPLDPGPMWYSCNTHSLNENGNRSHNYEVETTMRLISTEERLMVNQTWYCDDEGSASPAKFYAVGAMKLPNLKCRPRPEIEPDVADPVYVPTGTPIINGSVCTTSDFDINGKAESQYAMEPYALELPNPNAPKCTVLSFDPDKQYFLMSTAYVFRAHWWYFWRDGQPKGGFDVVILNSVTDRELSCQGFDSRLNANSTDFDPDYWFECNPTISSPEVFKGMKVNYNAHTGILSVGMTWSCNELSPKDPIVFTAFGRSEISKPECADDSDGTTRCLFPASNNIPLPFTNITWDMS
ncbi:hypothetical protein O1611_g4650 [Lasiodiplodia mahajangana]|uniref:Uncharacterized protein n=1 Tax=Lasiodiplodia mahajangana TaxID=1108764 RepID=A0ACC2JNJ8_9PEZI|nr:hypothetical protein O1611_g4650 [Lasiodiplodia mahajangana]